MSANGRQSRHEAEVWDQLVSAIARLDDVIARSPGFRGRRRVRRHRRDWPEFWDAVDELTSLLIREQTSDLEKNGPQT
jgi:hypothetical protein